MVIDTVWKSEAWQKSGGRDHVFVVTDPVAMWHVKDEIAPAVLVVYFGSWFRLDSKSSNENSSDSMIYDTQVSLLKDVIVPYSYLLPRLHILENQKGCGLVREKLWDLLINGPGVITEKGFSNATGKEQSCRLFDAIQSLCIPVIVSDNIELPFEGMVDYSEFSVLEAVSDALRPNWLVGHQRNYSDKQKDRYCKNMAKVQQIFEYENGFPGGISPTPSDGAVNHIC